MASGRLLNKNLKEKLTERGYTKTEKGEFYDVLSEFDDEGYIKKATAFAEGLTEELYKKMINEEDPIIATNEFATPKKKVIVIKYNNWLRDQVIHKQKFKESTLKRHWHDDNTRDDVINELIRRAEEMKQSKENSQK